MPFHNIAEIQAVLSAHNGRIIKVVPWIKANSLLKQFIQILTCQMANVSQVVKDYDNVERTIGAASENFRCNATADITNQGILIGTGTTPVTMTDYKLETQVTTDVAHGTVSFAVENPDVSSWRLSVSRGFENNTGSVLAVKEAALYCYLGPSLYRICIDHTLYSVNVPAGVTLTLTYRITVSL